MTHGTRLAGLRFDLVDDETGLLELRADWQLLAAGATWPNPFATFAWNWACFREQHQRAQPQVIVARDGGRVVGIAPLMRTTRHGGAVLVFIGDTRSDYLGFLASNVEVETALFDEAQRRRHGRPLILCNLVAETSSLHILPTAAHCNDAFRFVVHEDSAPSWIAGAARARHRWLDQGGSIDRVRGEVSAALAADVAAVETSSWKGPRGILRFSRSEEREFLRAAADCPELELWLARRGGVLLAFAIVLRVPGRVLLYQGSYDEAARLHSLGNVLDYAAIQTDWEAGSLLEYDYLSGREPYKTLRTNAVRPMYRLVVGGR